MENATLPDTSRDAATPGAPAVASPPTPATHGAAAGASAVPHAAPIHAVRPPVAAPLPPKFRLLPQLVFASRWLQVPLYLGLIVAQIVYVVLFSEELLHLIGILWDPAALTATVERLGIAERSKETVIMIIVLSLIDVVMISNLLIMVIIGGYETFVSRLNLQGHPDQPEWLSHVNANVLKVKLATAIVGISSIHLLKTFIAAGTLSDKTLMWQSLIHVIFLLSALGIAAVDRVMAHHTANHAPQGGHRPGAHH